MSDAFTMRGSRVVGDKILVTYSINVEINRAVNTFASALNLKKNQLHTEALLEYMHNHKKELPSNYTIEINLTKEEKTAKPELEKQLCLNGKCKEIATTSGVYDGVTYPLCDKHVSHYAGSKKWKIN